MPGVAGGFVGVDVFYVISGFLITGLLLRELRATGTVSLPRFYARRARRLLPAAMVALAVTMVASALLLPPIEVPDVAGDVAASALYVGNIRFALEATDYLAADLAPSPVLHFWSLGVEEQFYLFWPALLLGAARFRGMRATAGPPGALVRRIAFAVGGVLVASLALSLWLTDVNQSWAFFSLPTRAWELAVGALLAIGAERLARVPARAAAAAVWSGLALITAASVLLDTATPFPGTAAVLPVAGAALVIGGGLVGAPSRASRLLATGPMRFLGRISYSLYLWHWPIIVLPAAALDVVLPLPLSLGLAILTVPVAAASQRWIEEPIRHGRLARLPSRTTLASAGGLSVAVAIGALALGTSAGLPVTTAVAAEDQPREQLPTGAASGPPRPSGTPAAAGSPSPPSPDHVAPIPAGPTLLDGPLPDDLEPPLSRARDDRPVIYDDGCHLGAADVEPPLCRFGDVDATTTIVLFGDSHAAQWFPAVERIATERGWRLVSLTKSACPSVDVTVWNGSLRREYRECDDWRERAIERIERERAAVVVVANSRVATLLVDGVKVAATEAADEWRTGLARTLGRLATAAGRVVVVGDTPRASTDPPACLSRHAQDVLACATTRAEATDPAWLAGEAAVAASAGATFLDPTDLLCTPTTCPAIIDRYLVGRDEHHLATPFAASLAGALGALMPREP